MCVCVCVCVYSILASFNVENLFTNLSFNETIDIVINNIYNNQSLPPLKP